MHKTFLPILFVRRFAVFGLSALVLSSCGWFEKPPHKVIARHSHPKPQYQANEFVANVSLGDLELTNIPPDYTAAVPHLVIVEAYTSTKTLKAYRKTVSQPVIILSCSCTDKKDLQHAIAPFIIIKDEADANFTMLLEIMNKLQAMHCILQDIRPASIKVVPDTPIEFEDNNSAAAKILLDHQLEVWLKQGESLSPRNEVQVYITLVKFFMNHQMRDPAYLSVENAKQALAASVEKGRIDNETEKDLSGQLEALEKQLHETMPFTFGIFKFNK